MWWFRVAGDGTRGNGTHVYINTDDPPGGSEILEECVAKGPWLNPPPFLCAGVCRGSFLVVLPRSFFYPFAAPALFPNRLINLIIIK